MREQDAPRHRFFRTMVLMGSSLAIGCGGATEDAKSTSAGGAGGSGGTGGGGGGAGGSGAGGASGRGGSGALGGNGGSAGTLIGGSGGGGGSIISDAGLPPVDAGPFECHPAQWECGDLATDCRHETNSWVLPKNCGCNTQRPRTAEDCPGGTALTCRRAGYASDGRTLRDPVAFECSCQTVRDYCQPACEAAFPSERWSCGEAAPDSGRPDVLCGCAVVVLL